jgi:pimeloyl-ACP methyl ester carboxylesterase
MNNPRPVTMGFVTSKDGTTINFRQLGAGPGLVLLHGGMQASQNFTRLALELSDAFTVYVPDRRGRGLSGPHGNGYNLGKECEDVAALLAATGAWNLFGLSSGAIITLQTALTLPSIRKIALYEPPLSIDRSSPTAWVARYDSEVSEGRLAAAFVTVMKGVGTSPMFRMLPRFVLEPMIDRTLRGQSVADRDVPLSALIPTMHFDVQLVIETEGLVGTFKGIKAEVLLLGGGKSQKFLRVVLDALNATLARPRRVELAGLDHLGPDNSGRPEKVAAELREFFA